MRWSHAHPTWCPSKECRQVADECAACQGHFGRFPLWVAGCVVTSEMSNPGTDTVALRSADLVVLWHFFGCEGFLPERQILARHLPQMVSSKAVLLADLAVAEIPEDEDLLNVGTWEAAWQPCCPSPTSSVASCACPILQTKEKGPPRSIRVCWWCHGASVPQCSGRSNGASSTMITMSLLTCSAGSRSASAQDA